MFAELRVLLEKKLNGLGEDVHDRIIEALRVLRDEGFSRKLDLVKLRGYKNH